MENRKASSVKARVAVQGEYKGSIGEVYSDSRDRLSKLNGEVFVFIAITNAVAGGEERVLISQEMEDMIYQLTKQPQNTISSLDVEILSTNEQL